MRPLLVALSLLTAFPLATSVSAQDTRKKSEASAKGSLNKKDAGYLRRMAQADLAEVEAGKMASAKASSAEVKKFAQHMVDDHGKSLEEGKQLAAAKGVQPPSEPAKKHQSAMKKLEGQSGAAFDRAYMQQMVKDHQETLKLLQEAAKNAQDPDIKAAAQKMAPKVREHLKDAQQQVAALGGGKGGKGDKSSGSGGTGRKADSKPDGK